MLNEPSLLLPPSRLQSRSPLCALLPGRGRFRVLVEHWHLCYPWSCQRRPRRPPRFLPQVHAKFQGLVAAHWQTAPAASAPDDGSGRLTGQMTAPAASPDDGWSRSTSGRLTGTRWRLRPPQHASHRTQADGNVVANWNIAGVSWLRGHRLHDDADRAVSRGLPARVCYVRVGVGSIVPGASYSQAESKCVIAN